MLQRVKDIQSSDYSKGLNTVNNFFSLQDEQSPNMMDVKVNYDGSIQKRYGSKVQNATVITGSGGTMWAPINSASLSTSLQSYWDMDEPSGTRIDNFGNANLSQINGVLFGAGAKRNAASFNSTNSQYLILQNTASVATGDVDFSISTWFYLTTTGNYTIISKRDKADDEVTALLHMEGAHGSTTFVDSSLNAQTITTAGNVSIDTSNKKLGSSSAKFDGAGDYLTIKSSSTTSIGTDDFTVDFWLNMTSHSAEKGLFGGGGVNNFAWNWHNTAGGRFDLAIGGTTKSESYATTTAQWLHMAMTRSSGFVRVFVDGVEETNFTAAGSVTNSDINIGSNRSGTSAFSVDGYIDEFRFINGRSVWNNNFTVPTSQYSNPADATEFEYELTVKPDNIVNWSVSSSGTASDGLVRATSFGAVDTATWYNVIAWHDTGDTLGLSVNLSVNTSSYASGLRSGSAPFMVGAISSLISGNSSGATQFMNGRVDETGFWKKVLTADERSDLYNGGSPNSYVEGFNQYPWASFDFGATNIRWLTVSAGTGIFASSNLGVSWVAVATDRTANYQSFERSKNVLIATSESYDTPLFWAGSANTFAGIMNTSAPLAKYAINFQGFLILLNTNERPRSFHYEDENTQLTGDWNENFDIPSSYDDEITGAFILRKRLYVSTKFKLYRVTFVGGNPDWSFLEVKNFGFVPRTVKKLVLGEVGEVSLGLDYDEKIRFFDGSEDKIASDPIENDNDYCQFALDKISHSGSGHIVSFAETNPNDNVYKLCVAIGEDSSQTTHMINLDGRTLGYYPYQNQQFNTMVMADSANQRYLMAFDRSSNCLMLDTGNLDKDVTPIDDYWDSRFIFNDSPSQLSKAHKIDLYFRNTSAGNVYLYDKTDFSKDLNFKDKINITGSSNTHIEHYHVDLPHSFNSYQFRVTSSLGTNDPWIMTKFDLFSQGLGIGKTNR